MPTYNPLFLPEFRKQARKYRHLRNSISSKIGLLSLDPYHNCKSELLVGNLKGFRSARVTKSVRIIFAICAECRKRNFQRLIGCPSERCDSLPARTIIFLTVGSHDKAYR